MDNTYCYNIVKNQFEKSPRFCVSSISCYYNRVNQTPVHCMLLEITNPAEQLKKNYITNKRVLFFVIPEDPL